MKVKTWIIDTSEFLEESEMSIGDWHAAWRRFLFLMTKITDKTVVQRWSDHYDFLLSQEDFTKYFPAILKFDIEQRTGYFCSLHAFNEDQYYKRFERLRINPIKEEIVKERESLRAERIQYISHTNKYQPYSRDKSVAPYNSSDNTKSYRHPATTSLPSASSANVITSSPNAMRRRRRKESKRVESQIAKRDGNAPICFYFNASRKRCERRKTSPQVPICE